MEVNHLVKTTHLSNRLMFTWREPRDLAKWLVLLMRLGRKVVQRNSFLLLPTFARMSSDCDTLTSLHLKVHLRGFTSKPIFSLLTVHALELVFGNS